MRHAEALASALHDRLVEVDGQDLTDLARLDHCAGLPELRDAAVDVPSLPWDAVRLTCGDHAVGVGKAGGDGLLGDDALRAGRFRGKNDHVGVVLDRQDAVDDVELLVGVHLLGGRVAAGGEASHGKFEVVGVGVGDGYDLRVGEQVEAAAVLSALASASDDPDLIFGGGGHWGPP